MGDDAEDIRPADVIDWIRSMRHRHPDDYFVAVVGHDNAVRTAVRDCTHLLHLQLQLSDRTVRPLSQPATNELRNGDRLQMLSNG